MAVDHRQKKYDNQTCKYRNAGINNKGNEGYVSILVSVTTFYYWLFTYFKYCALLNPVPTYYVFILHK